MKGVVAKKSLLSFHTLDGSHSFTIISAHTSFFQEYHFRTLWMGSYDEAVEGFNHTEQLFGQAND